MAVPFLSIQHVEKSFGATKVVHDFNLDVAPGEFVSFLGPSGCGKTTVLNHLLRQPGLARTAVIVNELGEIGIDHDLVETATEDLVLLKSGCVCCSNPSRNA